MAMLFAFITLLGWGAGDLFVTIATKKIGYISSFFWGFIFCLILSSLYIPFAGPIADIRIFFLAFLLNIIHTTGNLSFFKALEVGKSSIVGTITGVFPIVTILISLLIFHEPLTMIRAMGILFCFAGLILVSLRFQDVRLNFKISEKEVLYSLITAIAWGVYFAFVRIPAEKIGWFWAGYPLYFMALFLPLFKGYREKIKPITKYPGVLKSIIIFVILIVAGDFSYNLGILYGYTSIVAAVAGVSPVLFVILSRFVFHEYLTRQKKLGIVLTLFGIILISVF